MVPFFGNKSRVSEVLNRKRGLALPMIRALHRELGIPAEVRIGDPKKDPYTTVHLLLKELNRYV